MGHGPWSAPPQWRWDLGWQAHLWAILRDPAFSRPAAEEIARDLTLAQLMAVWAATVAHQQSGITAAQQAATALLRDELLSAAELMGEQAYLEWLAQLWRDPVVDHRRRG